MQSESYPTIDPAFGHWLAGFIDGEGCFGIYRWTNRRRRRHHYPSFEIRLRRDDRMILDEIAARLGAGRVYECGVRQESRPGQKPSAYLGIADQAGCMRLVEVLDRYPLRAKKARDYVIWREAVLVRSQIRGGNGATAHRNDALWARMATLQAALVGGRVYQPGEAPMVEQAPDPQQALALIDQH